MGNYLLYVLVGLFTGLVSGLIGIGGGGIIIPILVFFFGMTQHQAQGTTLAVLVPPVGLLAALTYYRHGYVNLEMAAFMAAGFFLGGLFGARFAVGLSGVVLEKVFGVFLLLISVKMILGR
ncbi:MAG: sulfite exporter TauE/SafE family protein [bacterium]|nr:sulfite exporter TauE/SafE family protein [bacterium]